MQTAGGSARPLFGGALSAVVPHHATDISELRDIPDNQEVFAHARTDQSLVVELVEYQDQVADQHAARYHFDDVAASNEAAEAGASEVTGVAALPKPELSLSECSCAWTCTGTQRVAKFNEDARNTVTVHVGLFRLPQFSTDVLVTFNDPQSISPDSSSSISPDSSSSIIPDSSSSISPDSSSSISPDSSSSGGGGASAPDTHAEPWTLQDFQRLLHTLTLHNPGLFG